MDRKEIEQRAKLASRLSYFGIHAVGSVLLGCVSYKYFGGGWDIPITTIGVCLWVILLEKIKI